MRFYTYGLIRITEGSVGFSIGNIRLLALLHSFDVVPVFGISLSSVTA